ncbi:hypothetical protein [Paracoccus sp. IB05]|uniref:hypothetical protein n=1 Tax=Paracoccus sp. IB05 TaxID=2779367 RepID=UPI0018E73A88|nr:hypothetical protein [Paracoccus sp. IB05]MBJ2150983.1 hypothetical protein [Paracoccus sp. IB05]
MSYTNLTLPDRPLKLTPGSISPPGATLFAVIVMLIVGGFLAWWQAPDIWRDWQISQNPVTVEDSDVQNGQCTTRKAFFTDCEAHVAYNYQGQHYESDIRLMFVDFHSGDYWVDVVISGDKPHLATLSLGVEKIWNRILMLAAFALLFFGGAAAILWQRLRAGKASRALAQPSRLALLPLAITNMQNLRGKTQISYHDKDQPKPVLTTTLRKGDAPLMVWDDQGNGYGLGVKGTGARLPALLDRGLTRIDLTDQERREALALLDREEAEKFGQPQHSEGPAKKRGGGVLRNLLAGLGVILFFVLAALGWWLWYVTGSPDSHDPLGMEINAMMPAPINSWACGKLEERFGDQNAPYGCTADDYVSWK